MENQMIKTSAVVSAAKAGITRVVSALLMALISASVQSDIVYVHFEGVITDDTNPHREISGLSTVEGEYAYYSTGSTISGTLAIDPQYTEEPFTEQHSAMSGTSTHYFNQPYPENWAGIYSFPKAVYRGIPGTVGENSMVTGFAIRDKEVFEAGGYDYVEVHDGSEIGQSDAYMVKDVISIHGRQGNVTTRRGHNTAEISIHAKSKAGENLFEGLSLRKDFTLTEEQLQFRGNQGGLVFTDSRSDDRFNRYPRSWGWVRFDLTYLKVETVEGANIPDPSICYVEVN